jgi:microcin C transport system permease protein
VKLSPISQRRWANFKANRRGFWSLWLFLAIFTLTLFAEFVANDKPILASYKGELLYPVLVDYPEEKFGGFFAVTDFRDPTIQAEIDANGWTLWPPIRYSYRSVNNEMPGSAPTKPFFMYERKDLCARYPLGADDPVLAISTGWARMTKAAIFWRASSTASVSQSCSVCCSQSARPLLA